MKKKILKSLSLVIAACICLSLAAGCTDSGKNGMKTATIWMNTGHAKMFWENKIQQFNEEKSKELGVELVLDSKTDDSYSQAIQIAMQSNQLPEFYFDGGCLNAHELGVAYPLNDLPGMEDMIAQYKDLMVQNIHKVDDTIYCIPYGVTTRGLIYNKDMFKAAGIVDENGEAKPPKTFDEVREYAKILTDKSKQKYGIVFPVKWAAWVESDITSLAVSSSKYDFYNPATGEYDYNNLEPVIDMVLGIKADGSYYPGAEGLDNDPARAKFAEGNIGMKISYSFDVGVFNEQFPAKMDWGVAPLPVENTDECYKQLMTLGSSLTVSKTGVENIGPEAAAEIMKYLYSDDTIRELYKEGLEIPCIWDIVEDVELGENAAKGWEEFAEMVSISVTTPKKLPTDMQNTQNFRNLMINDIWTGKITYIKGTLAEYTKLANAGIQIYKDAHPDIKDYSIYYVSDWEEKVRREEY